MADSILRLKVDSQEYDQKIKRAAEDIQQYAQKCRDAGGTLQYLDDGVLEFVQALGKMDTVATGTKQQLREMSNALTTLTQTYRGLTDEEKASPFGQELAKGIQQLTERAGQAQDAMMDVQQSIRNAASDTRLFDQVAQGMSVATAGFQGLTGAGKLLGIEMGNDVEVIAKLQAAMAVTNSLTTIQTALQKQSALMQGVQAVQASAAAAAQTALAAATGNATLAQKAFNVVANMNPYVALATAIVACGAALYAFSSNSKDAEKAQKALNLELDHTKTALDQIDKDTDFSVSIAEASGKSWKAIHELRLEAARTKLQLADMNYDKLFASGASKEQMKQAADMQKQAWDNVMKVLNEGTIHDIKMRNAKKGSGSGSSTKQEDTNYAADSIMAQEKEVQRLTDQWKRASGELREGILKNLDAAKAKLVDMQNVNKSAEGGSIGDVIVKGNLVKSIERQFRDAATNLDAVNEYMSGIKSAIKNADLGSATWESLTEKMRDATSMSSLIKEAIRAGVDGSELDEMATTLKDKLLDGDIPDETIQAFIDRLNEKIEERGGVKLKLNAETGAVVQEKTEETKEVAKKTDELKNEISKVNTAIGGLTQINTGLKGLGLELGRGVEQVISVSSSFMQVIQGLHSFLSIFQTSALASNTAAITANTIALGVNSATSMSGAAAGAGAAGAGIAGIAIPVAAVALAGYTAGKVFDWWSDGGIVRAASGTLVGNSYSGDNLRGIDERGRVYGLNAGEVVLNRAQVGNLESQLESSGMHNVQLHAVIEGEDIVLATDNYYSRAGYGEVVTSRG